MATAKQTKEGPSRRHRRFNTKTLEVDNPVAGRVLNICGAGFALESSERLSVGVTYGFTIRRGSKQLKIYGRVQWCRFRSNGQVVYHAGIALADSAGSKAWQEALRRLTEHPAQVTWQRAPSRPAADAPVVIVSPGSERPSSRASGASAAS